MNSIGNTGRLLTAIPDLIYPAFKWGESDYAALQARLDLYDDFLVLSKYRQGQATAQYLVDPAELAAALAGINLHSGLLPQGCLFWGKVRGADRLGVYIPPQVRLVTVRDEPEAWRIPLPGLIFTGHEYNYSLWAVKEYPTTVDAPLYMAPCPNVHPEGVCRGNAPFPQAGPAAIWHAVDIFFSSRFNRDLSNLKSRAYPTCVLDQWQALHEAGAETYPPDDLVKTDLTLRRFIDDVFYFVDHDHVEQKNLVRQNFCAAEIGYPKAFSLAWRYTAAFGLAITPVVEQFSAALLDRYRPAYSPQGTLTLVVGAVDNVCARRAIAEALTAKLEQNSDGRHEYFWLDAGNERFSGQILIGNSLEPAPLLSPLGYCTGVPLPHIQEPSLLLDRSPRPVDLSCADLTLLEEQSAMINRAMATWLGVYLYRLLQSRDLYWSGSWLNLQGGGVRSTPITGGRLVAPQRPARLPSAGPNRETETGMMICPDCGGEIIRGEDDLSGVRIGVRFCDRCTFREEFCPECEGPLLEGQFLIEGDLRPALHCAECGWREPFTDLDPSPDETPGAGAANDHASGPPPPETEAN